MANPIITPQQIHNRVNVVTDLVAQCQRLGYGPRSARKFNTGMWTWLAAIDLHAAPSAETRAAVIRHLEREEAEADLDPFRDLPR